VLHCDSVLDVWRLVEHFNVLLFGSSLWRRLTAPFLPCLSFLFPFDPVVALVTFFTLVCTFTPDSLTLFFICRLVTNKADEHIGHTA
jgi:hypothetical protein